LQNQHRDDVLNSFTYTTRTTCASADTMLCAHTQHTPAGGTQQHHHSSIDEHVRSTQPHTLCHTHIHTFGEPTPCFEPLRSLPPVEKNPVPTATTSNFRSPRRASSESR
jgi:hypothetical protein